MLTSLRYTFYDLYICNGTKACVKASSALSRTYHVRGMLKNHPVWLESPLLFSLYMHVMLLPIGGYPHTSLKSETQCVLLAPNSIEACNSIVERHRNTTSYHSNTLLLSLELCFPSSDSQGGWGLCMSLQQNVVYNHGSSKVTHPFEADVIV